MTSKNFKTMPEKLQKKYGIDPCYQVKRKKKKVLCGKKPLNILEPRWEDIIK